MLFEEHRLTFAEFRPKLRSDLSVERFGSEAAVWSPSSAVPVQLGQIATLLLDVVDGVATARELVDDIASVLAIDEALAEDRLRETLEVYGAFGLLDVDESEVPLLDDHPRNH